MKKLLFTLASVAFLSYTMTSCVKDEEPTDNNKTATGIVGKWNTDEMNLVISDSITGIQLLDTTVVYGQGEIVQEFTEDGMVITTDVEGSDTTYYTYNDGKLLLSDMSDMSDPTELDATITAALKVGFLSTNSNPEHADTFYDFAIQTGMSFQMMDDYLDSFGDGELTGKKQGGDILEGKNTWLKIKSHEMNDAKTLELFSLQGQERIDAVVSFWKETNLDKQIRERAQNYYNNSMDDLDQIKKWGYDTTLLASLSEWLLGRTN